MTKVLIADDEPEMRKALIDILESAGFEVREAYDGLGALYEAKDYQPDLMLLDWMIPELTGNEVLRTIRRDDEYLDLRRTPVIVVSDFNDESSRASFDQAGANDFVPKNDNLDTLRDTLLAAIDKLGIKP